MINNTVNFILNFCIFIVIFAFQIIKPKITRKEIYFGIRVPENERDSALLKKVYKNYIVLNTAVFAILIIIMYIFLNYYASIEYTVLILLYLLFTLIIYIFSNKKVLIIKKQIVTIDTSFSKDKGTKTLVSPWWFLVPVLIISITFYIGFKYYKLLPEIVPTHWDFAGEINGNMMKSSKIIYAMPKFQIVIFIISFVSYKIIGWGKQQLNTSNPEQSKQKNKRFRYIWSGYMVFAATIMNLLFLYANLIIFQVAQFSTKLMIIMLIIIIGILVGVSIALSILTGQGGSRLKIKDNMTTHGKMLDRNDDKYWRFGIFYINKEDPTIFIEKRFGVGWTVNLGRAVGILLGSGVVIAVLMLPYILN
ncbi:DUF5808 domain-containing protein [Clostridium bowmanii]|uniref:DUF1648 domain-containing protein n=1 Tax=Clostridium bowmanii TaxID=132925 RepID=UPI001C0B79A4|nr:DUF5808 domain-containing protein [Clostridium bowmanii]MBU3188966.1 DUF1648 domain-containing protein [Clostridium bowmanii]MCA1073623.1 DUF5808 domain-containing protein [Clostridium bowmanii]